MELSELQRLSYRKVAPVLKIIGRPMGSHQEGATTHHGRVLIADRDSRTAHAIAATLRQKLVEVDIASSSSEVVELLSRESYKVAVMDLAILLSGAGEVKAQLDSMSQNARPIVLATTEGGGRTDLDADLVQIIIRKPVRTGELAEMIRACLEYGPGMRGASLDPRRPRLDLQRD